MLNLKNKQKLKKAFEKVLLSGNFILGQEVEGFEKAFAKYLGVKYCIGVGNGLEALQISLMALGVGKDVEVITTPISAAATTLAIMAVGAKPVFVDTDQNGLIDSQKIQPAINNKTKAILPVHLYGNSVDLKKIKDTCKKRGLFLIEDAAQAHGSKFNGKYLGTFGDIGCFSFYPTKNLGALGDGGAIVTDNKDLAETCLQIRDYGQKEKYVHTRYGLNSRLDEIQAAILKIKLVELDKNNQKRQKLTKRYIKNLSRIKKIHLVLPQNIDDANFHLFVIRVKNRNQLRKHLQQAGIQTLIHFPTIIPDQPFLKPLYKNLYLPVAKEFVKTCLSLPLNPQMSFKEVDFISAKIIEFYTKRIVI